MRKIWLVRHGERLDFNEQCEWYPEWLDRAKQAGIDTSGIDPTDAPLTADGVIQAKYAASIICSPVKHVYSSPFRRCLETAKEIAGAHKSKLSISTDLTEWMNPEWFNECYEHFKKIHFLNNRAFFAPGYPVIPESEQSNHERWSEVFNALKKHPIEDFPIVIVSHGGGVHHMLNLYNPRIMRCKGVQYADVHKIEL